MTDKPERTWVAWTAANATGVTFSCQSRPPFSRTEYVRADIHDAEIARLKQHNAGMPMFKRQQAEITRLTEQNKELGDMVHKRGGDIAIVKRKLVKKDAEIARLNAILRTIHASVDMGNSEYIRDLIEAALKTKDKL